MKAKNKIILSSIVLIIMTLIIFNINSVYAQVESEIKVGFESSIRPDEIANKQTNQVPTVEFPNWNNNQTTSDTKLPDWSYDSKTTNTTGSGQQSTSSKTDEKNQSSGGKTSFGGNDETNKDQNTTSNTVKDYSKMTKDELESEITKQEKNIEALKAMKSNSQTGMSQSDIDAQIKSAQSNLEKAKSARENIAYNSSTNRTGEAIKKDIEEHTNLRDKYADSGDDKAAQREQEKINKLEEELKTAVDSGKVVEPTTSGGSSSSGKSESSVDVPTPTGDGYINPDDYKPKPMKSGDYDRVASFAGKIISVISVIGIVISVVMIIALGIKYIVGTVEERAEYKKNMVPMLVGAIMIFSISTIVDIIYNITNSVLGG